MLNEIKKMLSETKIYPPLRLFTRLWRINFDFCILKCLTLFQIMAYEKQTPKFSIIQAIWRTIQRYFESISRVIRYNSSIIQDLSAAGVTIGAMV